MEGGRMVQRTMDASEIEENVFSLCDAKLHGGMCKKLSSIACKVLAIFPVIEAARPRSKSGIQALCSLHVAIEKSKNLLNHCSNCSKFYLAITGESILIKFEKARCALQESLKGVEDIVPQSIGLQIVEIVNELERTTFSLDRSEKQVGDEVIQLLKKDRKIGGNSDDIIELEVFHQAATKLGIVSSRAALTERRALKKLIEKAHAEEDKRKESIVEYLLHLMRKYSKLFRSEFPDDTDSQGSTPCSPTVLGAFEANSGPGGNGLAFERQLSKMSSFNFKPSGIRSGSMPIPPEELRCPISLQLMYDPVIISSGQTYERVCIEKWFNDGHCTCPKTQQQLSHLCVTPNYCVKGLIGSWCEQNGLSVPDGPPESLDLNYWRLALSECEATDSQSVGSIDSFKLKDVKVVPLEANGTIENHGVTRENLSDTSYPGSEMDEFHRYEKLLSVICEGTHLRKKCKAVEQIRFLLMDDEEARIYMGANGIVEALVRFLRLAIDEGDEKSQEVGAMALFNLAVNNNRNKGTILSSGILSLLEDMIQNSAYEAATALYLNLSCLEDAKPIIGSSKAVAFLVQLLRAPYTGVQCKADALHALYNLSTHPTNIPTLLSADVVAGLHSLITGPSGPEGSTWVEKSMAILMNLASSKSGKREITSTPGLLCALATLLDTGEVAEQEEAAACLLALCAGDQRCSQLVLQEGVVPALVSLSVNGGTSRAKEKAQKLLALFREQRQREPSPSRLGQQQPAETSGGAPAESKPLCKSKSKKLGRTLSSMWKNKNFTVYQC